MVALRGDHLLKFNYMEKSKGLGDTVEKITKVTGIKSLFELGGRYTGKKECGCNKRKEKLNKMFPYKK